jgi:hypothetical protein
MIENAILTALFTLIGGCLLFLITKIIELYVINPYYEFKKEIIETEIILRFNSALLTNQFDEKYINHDYFFERLILCQDSTRKQYCKLSVKYKAIPKIFFKKKIPTQKEMKIIENNLLYLSNRNLIKKYNKTTDCESANNKLEEIYAIFARILN